MSGEWPPLLQDWLTHSGRLLSNLYIQRDDNVITSSTQGSGRRPLWRICKHYTRIMGRDNSFRKATKLQAGSQRNGSSIPHAGKNISPERLDGLWGPSSLLSGYRALSPAIRRPGHETDGKLQSTANLRMSGAISPCSHTSWRRSLFVILEVKHAVGHIVLRIMSSFTYSLYRKPPKIYGTLVPVVTSNLNLTPLHQRVYKNWGS